MAKTKRMDDPKREPLPGQTSFLPPFEPPEDVVGLSMTVLVADFPEGAYVTTHVDVQLDQQQAEALKRVVTGLDRAGARLVNGRRVQSHADAIKFMLEAIAQAVPFRAAA